MTIHEQRMEALMLSLISIVQTIARIFLVSAFTKDWISKATMETFKHRLDEAQAFPNKCAQILTGELSVSKVDDDEEEKPEESHE